MHNLVVPRSRRDRRYLVILLHDLAVMAAAFVLAFLLRTDGDLSPAHREALLFGLPLNLVIGAAVWEAFELHRRVWGLTSIPEVLVVGRLATVIVALLLLALFVVDRAGGVPRSVPLIYGFVLSAGLLGSRLLYRLAAPKLRRARGAAVPAGDPRETALILGGGRLAALLLGVLRDAPQAPVRVVGVVDLDGEYAGRSIHGVPVIGSVDALPSLLDRLRVHGVTPSRLIVADNLDRLGDERRARLHQDAARLELRLETLPGWLGPWSGGDAAAIAPRRPDRGYLRAKRLVDLGLSAALLVLAAPLLPLIVLAVRLDVGAPVLFRQVRPGRHLRPITIPKFRTMRDAIAPDGRLLADEERLSPFGRLLRRSRLDELPQLASIFSGDMAFIGPRPLLWRDLPVRHRDERASLRPGLTGWAQVNGGHSLTAEQKLALDLHYARHAGPRLDLVIVLRTLNMMLRGERVNPKALAEAGAGSLPEGARG